MFYSVVANRRQPNLYYGEGGREEGRGVVVIMHGCSRMTVDRQALRGGGGGQCTIGGAAAEADYGFFSGFDSFFPEVSPLLWRGAARRGGRCLSSCPVLLPLSLPLQQLCRLWGELELFSMCACCILC